MGQKTRWQESLQRPRVFRRSKQLAGSGGRCKGGLPIRLGWLLPVRKSSVCATPECSDNGDRYAFPNDELHPISNSFSNSRNGWGASAADALSTALIMEIPEIVNEIVAYVPTIDWSVSYQDEPVSLFETTIRYLGGLISGYDLLTGPLSHLVNNVGFEVDLWPC